MCVHGLIHYRRLTFPEKYDQHQASLSRARARVQESLDECRRLRVSLENGADKAEQEALEVDTLQARMLVWAGVGKTKGGEDLQLQG